jgi:hypothetical protein
MTRHLRPVEQPKPRRPESRREIELWLEERHRVLSALAEGEGLGQDWPRPLEQLSLEEGAA